MDNYILPASYLADRKKLDDQLEARINYILEFLEVNYNVKKPKTWNIDMKGQWKLEKIPLKKVGDLNCFEINRDNWDGLYIYFKPYRLNIPYVIPVHWLFNDFTEELKTGHQAYLEWKKKDDEYRAIQHEQDLIRSAKRKLTSEEWKALGLSNCEKCSK